jgi:hypothetical protein
MPKIRRKGVPLPLVLHLRDRMHERGISMEQLELLLAWLDTEPDAPGGGWYKRFPGLTVCGQGELVKTFLRPDQTPVGEALD